MVAQVEQFIEREALLAHCVQAHINLQPLAVLLKRRKAGLPLGTNSHDASGHGHGYAIGFQGLGPRIEQGLVPPCAHLGNGVRGRELVGIGLLPQLHDLFEF